MALVMPTPGRRVFSTLRAPHNWPVWLLAMVAVAIRILVLMAVG